MHRYTVELRIIGPELDPEQVTEHVGLQPTLIRRKGEPRSKTSNWTTTTWAIEVLPPGRDDWPSLEEGLNALLSLVGPIWNRISPYSALNEILFWCGHFTSSFDGGPVLTSGVLKSLADLRVPVAFDTYCEKPPDS